jgi:apolipoprotein N-acyltransferase
MFIALAGLAGAALPLAFAPFGWWWLAPACYAILFFVWRGRSPRFVFLCGFVFGCAEFLLGTYWIYISVHVFSQAPIWLAVFLTVGLAAVMALYPALVGWAAAKWLGTAGGKTWLATLPALFVLAEWLRGWVLTGFGWLSPGYSQTDTWLLGLAPVLGVLGVGWAVLLLAGALVALGFGTRRERLAAGIVAVGVLGAAGALDQIEWTAPKPNPISVALAQGAIPQDQKWKPEQLPSIANLYRELTADALGADLIVWPEAAVPQYFSNMRGYLAGIETLAATGGSRVMLGMPRYDATTGMTQNAVFVLGRPDPVYVKRHLVPYGEYFPLPGFVHGWLKAMNLDYPDLEAGASHQPPVALLGERIAVTICYEDVFGAEQLQSFPAATLLVNVSNDAWFGDSIAAAQHLQIARVRAAEVERYLLRSTSTGITGVVGPKGEILARLPQFTSDVLRSSVRGMTGSTPYIVWGNAAVVLLALAVLAGYRASTKLTMRPGT